MSRSTTRPFRSRYLLLARLLLRRLAGSFQPPHYLHGQGTKTMSGASRPVAWTTEEAAIARAGWPVMTSRQATKRFAEANELASLAWRRVRKRRGCKPLSPSCSFQPRSLASSLDRDLPSPRPSSRSITTTYASVIHGRWNFRSGRHSHAADPSDAVMHGSSCPGSIQHHPHAMLRKAIAADRSIVNA
jgi:hypothetical protein